MQNAVVAMKDFNFRFKQIEVKTASQPRNQQDQEDQQVTTERDSQQHEGWTTTTEQVHDARMSKTWKGHAQD